MNKLEELKAACDAAADAFAAAWDARDAAELACDEANKAYAAREAAYVAAYQAELNKTKDQSND